MAEPPGTTNPENIDDDALELPPTLHTCCRALVRDPAVSVHVALHEPNYFAAHCHRAVQVLVTFANSLCDASWTDSFGRAAHCTIEANQIWILPAGVVHVLHWRKKAKMVLLLANSEWARSAGYERAEDAMLEKRKDYECADPVIGALTWAFGDDAALVDSPGDPQIQSLGQCLAARIFNVQATALRRRSAVTLLHPDTRARVLNYIEINLGVEISAVSLAREARMSPSHFCKVFKASTGLTPEQYVLRARLWKAREMICAGSHTVGEIAHATGFADHSHLTVQFKRRFGVPPKAYLPFQRYI